MTAADEYPKEGDVRSGVADGVGVVAFSHPKGNALPGALLRRLAATITEVGARPDVRVVSLRSTREGPFCAGASFDELMAVQDEQQGKEFFLGFARVVLAMIRCPKPIVTRVQGKVVGGGVGLVAASDYVIATEHAQMRLSELAVGIGPFVVGPAIQRKIGPGAFGAMALDADWRTPRWALEVGLYAQVHDGIPGLDSAYDGFVAHLAKGNAEATARIKQTLWEGTEHWDELLDQRAALSGRLVLSEHTRRAIEAFRSR
ncbi:MAG TPA: enoyl-CoA hydratase/isomerase family protein [Gemmatimonadaceae bacterium]|nr:enoyl-CoA hydratase/isomerase family protein [Gemmatimonadaceae bacterium]